MPGGSPDPFRPPFGTAGGQRQTLLGYLLRRRVPWGLPTEDLVVDVEPDVRLLVRASWQPGPRTAAPVLVLAHGLAGSDASTAGIVAGRRAYERGWHVLRMNMRGAGESVDLCPRLYNAGLDGDLLAVLVAASEQAPRCALLGFSLGGNLTLLTLARRADRLPPGFLGAVAVCPTIDLSSCADALERPGNRLYQWYFMDSLWRDYRERQRRRPDLFGTESEKRPRTIREWDEAITAPHGGFAGAAEYYARSSAGPLLSGIDKPALILSAADDPMIPIESVTRYRPDEGSAARMEVCSTGGHVGFVSRFDGATGFWAGDRGLDFLEALR